MNLLAICWMVTMQFLIVLILINIQLTNLTLKPTQSMGFVWLCQTLKIILRQKIVIPKLLFLRGIIKETKAPRQMLLRISINKL